MRNPEQFITVETLVQAPIEKIWEYWTGPEHIKKWNNPSDQWHTPYAENDIRTGGKFLFVMGTKDGSNGFDFKGVYDEVRFHEKISYTTSDGRTATNLFTPTPAGIRITETFEPSKEDPAELQRDFVAGVLRNFKAYVEDNI
jgi:uncharacterized protein YndB with AHSA1/START domain